MKRSELETLFENALWLSRLAVLVPVVFSAFMAFVALLIGTVDILSLLGDLTKYFDPGTSADEHSLLHAKMVTTIVSGVDVYLLAAILLIFAFGLYELFISKINPAEQSEVASRLLLVRSLDDLKNRLGKVVILFLVIEFLKEAVYRQYRHPVDILYLAIGIVLVGIALYLTGRSQGHSE